MRSHRTILSILKGVLILIKDLSIFLPNVLTKHGNCLVPRLMIKCQQVHAELVIYVLGDCFSFIVLLRSFDAILLVLNPASHCGSPILDRRHALLSEELFCILGIWLGVKGSSMMIL